MGFFGSMGGCVEKSEPGTSRPRRPCRGFPVGAQSPSELIPYTSSSLILVVASPPWLGRLSITTYCDPQPFRQHQFCRGEPCRLSKNSKTKSATRSVPGSYFLKTLPPDYHNSRYVNMLRSIFDHQLSFSKSIVPGSSGFFLAQNSNSRPF